MEYTIELIQGSSLNLMGVVSLSQVRRFAL
jgi:hypothetical protein